MSTEKFHWSAPNGGEIVLPHMNKIKAGVLRKHRKKNEVDFLFSLLEEIGDDATLAKIDDLTTAELNTLAEAWQAAGASVGESSGSSS